MNKNISVFQKHLSGDFNFPNDSVGEKMLREYGALFVAGNGASAPRKVVFENESEVADFQNGLKISTANIAGFNIELQTAAMRALKKAIKTAEEANLSITPRGADSARRSYAETVELWASRVGPALIHWFGQGRLTDLQVEKIQSLSPFEQVSEIFKLEKEGIYFSKDLSKSIIYSVAPPGTSQHLAMLALDIQEHNDENVREIMARHEWFQTVISDLPHFTFLGIAENELENHGLKRVSDGGRDFWIPDL